MTEAQLQRAAELHHQITELDSLLNSPMGVRLNESNDATMTIESESLKYETRWHGVFNVRRMLESELARLKEEGKHL